MKNSSVPTWEKYALSIEEAAEYFHIGEKKLYNVVNANKSAAYLLWIGNRVLIKRELFEKQLNSQNSL